MITFDKPIKTMSIEEIKEATLKLLDSIQDREIASLRNYLLTTDYFTAPAARSHHAAYPGGLAKHSLQLYPILCSLIDLHGLDYPESTKILVPICHDLCKVGFYFQSDEAPTTAQINYMKDLYRNKAFPQTAFQNKRFCSDLIGWAKGGFEGPQPECLPQYEIKDDFPLGHGEKSALIASNHIDLTEEELLAIRWHCGEYEISKMNEKSFEASRAFPLTILVYHSDYQSTFITERSNP